MVDDYGGDTDAAIKITDGTTNVYIECYSWSCYSAKLDEIFNLADNTSFNTQIGEKKQFIKCRGRLVFDTNVGVGLVKIALERWQLKEVAPVSAYIRDEYDNKVPFLDITDPLNATVEYLKGYPMNFTIKEEKHEYTIDIHFEECQN